MHILADQDHGDEGIEVVSNYADHNERKAVFDCTIETSRLFYDLWNLYSSLNRLFGHAKEKK